MRALHNTQAPCSACHSSHSRCHPVPIASIPKLDGTKAVVDVIQRSSARIAVVCHSAEGDSAATPRRAARSRSRPSSLPRQAAITSPQAAPAAVKVRTSSSRAAQLDQLREDDNPTSTTTPSVSAEDWGLDAGWEVVVPSRNHTPNPPSKTAKKTPETKPKPKAASPPPGSSSKAKKATPFMDLQSEEGILGMALLHQKLTSQGRLTKADVQDLASAKERERAAKKAARASGAGLVSKLADQQAAQAEAMKGAAAAAAARRGSRQRYTTDGDGDEAELEFQLVLGEQGVEETIDYRRKRSAEEKEGWQQFDLADDDEDDDLADEEEVDLNDLEDADETITNFDQFGWDQFDALEGGADDGDGDDDDVPDVKVIAASKRRAKQPAAGSPAGLVVAPRRTPRGRRAEDYEVLPEPEDWGLDELANKSARLSSSGGSSGSSGSSGGSVQWGGTGAVSRIDYDEQEAMLRKIFPEHKVAQLMAAQREVEESYHALKIAGSAKMKAEQRLHSHLRIIGGEVAGRMLMSSQGEKTRPMMEKVKAAIFNMILSQTGDMQGLPPKSRWLDLFAGTGSVGLEALSRGVGECHFVEMDKWVVKSVLSRNIATCGYSGKSITHQMKAEDFLTRAGQAPRFCGGPFDFISMCPPYLLVSYPQLFDLLPRSNLMHDSSIVFVEYPKQLSRQVPEELGSLVKVRDRKYGRTNIAVYAPSEGR